MLDSLDTLIAFALIFTVVSLLITIVVQMISAGFNLRGCNLAWGIAEAFEAIEPDLAAKAKTDGANSLEKIKQWLGGMLRKFFPESSPAKKLADHCLNDSLVSDSQFLGFKGRATAVRTDELFDLLHRIATGTKPGSPDEIKKHAVSLFKALGVPDSVFELAAAERAKLVILENGLREAVAGFDGPAKDALQKALDDTTAKLAGAAIDAKKSAEAWAEQREADIQRIYQKFEHWFETGQERAQEWFTTHARIITAILGLAFAFWLQLDTIEIFKLVSSNREVRANLVAQVKPVIEQGEKILKESATVVQDSVEKLAKDKGSQGTEPDPAAPATADPVVKAMAAKIWPGIKIKATDSRESVYKSLNDAFKPAYKAELLTSLDAALSDIGEKSTEPSKDGDFNTALTAKFTGWLGGLKDANLQKALENTKSEVGTAKSEFRSKVEKGIDIALPQSSVLAALKSGFDDRVDGEVAARMGVSKQQWTDLKGSLDKTGFSLFPKDGWRWVEKKKLASFKGKTAHMMDYLNPKFIPWLQEPRKHGFGDHCLGMVFSALLLSLGAPFWFNTLKSLSSLRSTVAGNISDEKKAEQEKGLEKKPGNPPPTVAK